MKKITLILCTCAAAMLITSCGPSKEDAIKYNDNFIAIQKSLSPTYDGFVDQLDGHNADSLKIMYALFDAKAKSALEECKKVNPFNKKSDYLDAAIEYFKTIDDLTDNEGKQIVDIMTRDSSKITEADVATVTTAAGKFDSEYARILQKVEDAQAAFAKEWKFEVTKSK
jgi:hypothetical protein